MHFRIPAPAPLILAAALSLAPGCSKSPTTAAVRPELKVTPAGQDFGTSQTQATLTIENAGTGTLEWTVSADRSWIGVTPTSGSTTTGTSPVTLTVSRAGQAPGTYTGTVTVRPAMGDAVAVPVSMQVVTGTSAKVVFLHHSTGGVVWNAGVPAWFDAYNAAHGTGYVVTEQLYPSTAGGYPYANYPYDYWNIWVNHAGASPYLGESTLELLTPQYDVIVFKHCFPVSDIGPDTGSPDVASPVQTLENYELQYAALRAKLRSFPSNRFIVWTGAAKLAVNTTPEKAARAKEFFDWVRTVWDEPGDNIYVWDFFGLETDGGMYLSPEHAASASDDHPNTTFAAEVAPLFAQRVVDVIEGRGD
jgi:hypothetical protein